VSGATTSTATLVRKLHEIGVVRLGDFVLKDGSHSPIYIDLRVLAGHPAVLRLVSDAMLARAKDLRFDCIAGIPYAGLPLAVAMCLAGDIPLVYPRKEVKEYGTRKRVEGVFAPGARALVVDDVITTGGAKIEALAPLRDAGLEVEDILVVVDRQQAGAEVLADSGLRLHSVLTLSDILDQLEADGALAAEDAARARSLIVGPAC
jgi:uridine monophosphate synthetase